MDFNKNMMSTPLRENNKRYSHSPLLTPSSSRLVKNRYCMSETISPHSKMLNNYAPGPLLTPTNYNTSVSTYIDCKSPGFSSRIVQYNNDTIDRSEPFVLHQAKYSSPGMFPIVHLQKKNLPVRKLSRDTVTMRLIATHDSPTFSMNNNGLHHNDETADVSTNNVLKALREISKKRMLPEDILLPQNNNKRQRSDCHVQVPEICIDLDNPTTDNDNSLKKPTDEIPCVVDALAASLTSSNASFVTSKNALKRKSTKMSPEISVAKIPKQSLIEVETQTDSLKVSSVTQTVEQETKKEEIKEAQSLTTTSTTDTTTSTVPNIHAQVYEDTLNEKVATKLAAFTGVKPPVSIISSIISPPNKPKHDKHVTFSLENDTSEKSVEAVVQPLAPISVVVPSDKAWLTTPTPLNSPVLQDEASNTFPKLSEADVTPVSQSVAIVVPTPSSTITTTSNTFKLATPALFTSAVTSTSSYSDLLKLPPPVLIAASVSSGISIANSISIEKSVANSLPAFGFMSPTELKTSNSQVTLPPTSVTFGSIPMSPSANTMSIIFGSTMPSEPKSFFNHQPESTPVTSAFVLPTNQISSNEAPAIVGFPSTLSKPGGFKFDLGGTSSVSVSTTPMTQAEPSFSFGKPQLISTDFGNINKSNTVTTQSDSTLSFANSKLLTPSLGNSSSVSISAPAVSTFSFGSTKLVTSELGGFSNNSIVAVTKTEPAFSFGNAKPAANISFGGNTTVTSTFGASSIFSTGFESKTSQGIGFPVLKDDSKPKMNPPIVSSQQSLTSSKLFDFAPKSEPALFNTDTQSMSSPTDVFKFGSVSTTTVASAFPTPVPNDINTFKFGATVTATPSMFNTSVSKPEEANMFKFGSSVFNSPNSFTNSKPSTELGSFKFGTTTTTSAFTAPQFSSVQQSNDTSNFHFGVATTTTVASVFNKPIPTPAFNTTSQNQNEQSIFKFGAAPVTTEAPVFNAPGFHFSTPISKAPPPSFPATTSSFSSFGAFESKPANPFNSSGFGDAKSMKSVPPFGTNQAFGTVNKPAPSIFGVPTQQTSNAFGTFNNNPAPAFATPAPQVQAAAPAQAFQFGATNNPPPNVFSFGASNEPPKPVASNIPSGVFSFGANTTNNTFGATPTPTFGAAVATSNNFGMQPPTVPAFGTAIQPANMFNIGSGTSTPKPARTQLKARRRT